MTVPSLSISSAVALILGVLLVELVHQATEDALLADTRIVQPARHARPASFPRPSRTTAARTPANDRRTNSRISAPDLPLTFSTKLSYVPAPALPVFSTM